MMLGRLEEAGHEIVQDIENSDLVILNTCAVKRPTLNRNLHRMRELKEMDKKVIIAGCLPLIDPEKIEELGGFEGVISCLTTDRIEEVVKKISKGKSGIETVEGESKKTGIPRYRSSDISAPVPIAEGCVSNCSYCSVKFARRELRSFPSEDIIRDIKGELKHGRREIYVTAQDTGAYGLDIDTNLPELLKKISSIPEKFRVRVGMMNPKQTKGMTEDLIDSYRSEKIYKFIHLPIQSGNDRILDKMRREYTVEDFWETVSAFKDSFSELYLATDIIVGFPGETREEFEDSCDLVRKIMPDKINLTRFTPMPNTDAKEMDQIDSEEKKRRSRKLTKIHHEVSYEKNLEYVGERAEGLVIKRGEKGGYVARIHNYKPVIVEKGRPGDFVEIEINEAKPTYLMGEVKEVKNEA